jgi:hypothetical protein
LALKFAFEIQLVPLHHGAPDGGGEGGSSHGRLPQWQAWDSSFRSDDATMFARRLESIDAASLDPAYQALAAKMAETEVPGGWRAFRSLVPAAATGRREDSNGNGGGGGGGDGDFGGSSSGSSNVGGGGGDVGSDGGGGVGRGGGDLLVEHSGVGDFGLVRGRGYYEQQQQQQCPLDVVAALRPAEVGGFYYKLNAVYP